MSLIQTLLSFLFALAVLIAFHEWGHYWVARKCGVKVLRFSLGFGKPLWMRRLGPDQTEWVVAAFPLGGYVKMLDEREGEVDAAEAHRAFNRQPVSKRMAIVAAGPIANFLLAIALYWVAFMYGIPGIKPILGDVKPNTPAATAGLRSGDTIVAIDDDLVPTSNEMRMLLIKRALDGATPVLTVITADGYHARRRLDLSKIDRDDLESDLLVAIGTEQYQPLVKPVIGRVEPGGAAESSGIRVGDEIKMINKQAVVTWEAMASRITESAGLPLQIEIVRDGAVINMTVVPRAVQEKNRTIGRLGIGPKLDPKEYERLYTEVRFGPVDALTKSVAKTWDMSWFSLSILGKMVMGDVSVKNLSGPITIANYAGQFAKQGILPYVLFLAAISISLGVLNLLPIPLLDGGHLLYYMAEIIKGKPLSERALEIGQGIGLALLLTLMAFAFYNDLNRLLAG